MKIVCSKQDLVSGVNIVSRAVPSNTTMSLLQCILIQAGNGEIRLTANDMELGIETVISGQIEVAGMVAVEAKKLLELIRKLPDGDITIETDNDYILNFSCSTIKSNPTLIGRSGEEYTFLPKVERDEEILISMYTFKDIIRQVIFSRGNGDINKVMSGVNMVIRNDQMRVTTLDGHRVSIRKVQLKNMYSERDVIIPGKALDEVSKIIPAETEKDMSIFFSEAHVVFEFDRTVVVTRLIDGNYINVDKMISSACDTKVTINKQRLSECIDRSMFYSREGNKKPIVIDVMDGELNLTVNSADGGLSETIDIVKQGKDLKIGFNPRFIYEALRVLDEEEIDMYFVNARSPLYIKDENERYIYMILPINLNL